MQKAKETANSRKKSQFEWSGHDVLGKEFEPYKANIAANQLSAIRV
jgi:hypothetical protein